MIILSDGWDRGEPEVLAAEMERLRRSAHRVVWLNPLAAHPEYAPLTRGMQAALPHTDHLLAGNTIASLEDLADDPGGRVTSRGSCSPPAPGVASATRRSSSRSSRPARCCSTRSTPRWPCRELERVVVVLGARAEQVRAAIAFGRAEPVVCPDWEQGQAASLRCGLRALEGAERIVVTLGDQPWVGREAIMRLARQPAGTRAAYDGVPGHPVVLGEELAAAAMELEGDEGARGLLRGARTIECGDVADARDVDTVGDLKEMLT